MSLSLRFQNQVEVSFVPLEQEGEPLSGMLWFLTLPGEPNYDWTSKDREVQQVKLHLQRWWVRSPDSHKLGQQKPRLKSTNVSSIIKRAVRTGIRCQVSKNRSCVKWTVAVHWKDKTHYALFHSSFSNGSKSGDASLTFTLLDARTLISAWQTLRACSICS